MNLGSFWQEYKWVIVWLIVVLVVVAIAEHFMGRLTWGPDGRFGWWDGNIYSSENSQRVFDAYSLTHVIHGFGFYLLLWLVARRLPAKYRLVAAIILEGAWEVLENSPIIINRYREVTISLGYLGDSVLNSLSDILMMALGFLLAWRLKVWASVVTVIAIEIALLLWVKDNLTLNLIMLIHPIDAIKNWQSAGH
ncbi:MAG TPA: DUF2585 family protein [Candidatus Limnocylindria bacterium]|nr:DUF2585 family protein [Candidatus Limnocylindria bacterium]